MFAVWCISLCFSFLFSDSLACVCFYRSLFSSVSVRFVRGLSPPPTHRMLLHGVCFDSFAPINQIKSTFNHQPNLTHPTPHNTPLLPPLSISVVTCAIALVFQSFISLHFISFHFSHFITLSVATVLLSVSSVSSSLLSLSLDLYLSFSNPFLSRYSLLFILSCMCDASHSLTIPILIRPALIDCCVFSVRFTHASSSVSLI